LPSWCSSISGGGLNGASPYGGGQEGNKTTTTKTAPKSCKGRPAKAPADKNSAASERVNAKPGFDWAAAIEKTGKSLNALCVEAGGPASGANPSQIRGSMKGEVARVERG
jgi:hypothetical protein